ncbi:PspC domain-containing protein [Patescibacteria group bacterium]|nr:PspC domain-containing protein [Patescibacteria group bacterium]
MVETTKKLYRSNKDYVIAGVAGGLGEYFGVDSIIIRLLLVVLALGGGSGILIYLVLAIIVPREPGEVVEVDRKEKVEKMAQDVGERVKKVADEYRDDRTGERRHGALGWIVLLLGLFLLLNQVIPGWFRADLFWPVALILAGVYLMVRR